MSGIPEISGMPDIPEISGIPRILETLNFPKIPGIPQYWSTCNKCTYSRLLMVSTKDIF